MEDLVSRMTLEEKIECLGTKPAVARLGVTGSAHEEGLHGLALGGPAALGQPRPRSGGGRPCFRSRAVWAIHGMWALMREAGAVEGV